MVGRINKVDEMKSLLTHHKSSFVAVTGRRRVGKTYLIDQVYEKEMCFRVTGIQNGLKEEQLANFSAKLAEYTKSHLVLPAKSWQDAFLQLKSYLLSLDKKTKKVIFIDELPWISTMKSGFIQMLAHLWNDYLSKEKHFILVICGSATSWITKHIINDKGGLHNRITNVIKLKPFTLAETKLFFKSQNIKLSHQEISKLYMVMGGIPFYLENVKKGESTTVAIERMCFSDDGILKNEYQNLYRALFKNADNHEKIVEILADYKYGLTRDQIIDKTKIKAGGPYNRVINDLLESGFVREFSPFGRKKKGTIYRLNDEYSIFYHQFIKSNKKYTKGIWQRLSEGQSYKIWTGHAFELQCYKHLDKIKDALGISGVYTEFSDLRVIGNKENVGFQIDLIIDRKDATINLCEIKYYSGSFKIDKNYAKTLLNRKRQFIEHTKTKKNVFITLITNYGVLNNEYAKEVVDAEIELDDFF